MAVRIKPPLPRHLLPRCRKPRQTSCSTTCCPWPNPPRMELHFGVAVLEVGDPAQLLELAADTALRPFLLCRLAPTVALVDPGRADELAEMLRRRG